MAGLWGIIAVAGVIVLLWAFGIAARRQRSACHLIVTGEFLVYLVAGVTLLVVGFYGLILVVVF